MAEETKVETQAVEPVETEVVEQQASVEEHVDRARQMGWRPLEEYDGDKSRWVDAREFILRGELYDRLHQSDRKYKDLQATVTNLIEHNKKVEKMAYERALEDLKAAKKNAMEQADAGAVVAIDDKIFDVKEQMKVASQQTQSQNVQQAPPEYFDFANANPWYTKDKAMTAYADQYGISLHQQGYDPAHIYKMVEAEVKKEFAHKFQRPAASASVDGGSSSTAGGKKSAFAPSEQERQLAQQFVRHGVYKNVDEYYKQLKQMNTKGGN